MRVLLADDSATQRTIVRLLLEASGHDVACARDGLEVVEMVGTWKPDLAIMDIDMPGLSGLDATRTIRADTARDWFPIIFVTGRTDSREIAKAIEAGGDDYLTKPVDPIVLGAKMRAMERIAEMRRRLVDTTAELSVAKVKLEELANEDSLTGLGNRRLFDSYLANEMLRSRRNGMPLSLLMMDVDYFKAYNDLLGHPAGDACLREVAQVVKNFARRPTDLVARYGGEEFAVILPETPSPGALRVAERFLETLRSRKIPHPRRAGAIVGISVGVATTSSARRWEVSELIGEADRALYEAKQSGRDRVEVAKARAGHVPLSTELRSASGS